jgi:hypothetical protein
VHQVKEPLAQRAPPDGNRDAALEQEASHVIDHDRATRDETRAEPVDRLQIQLLHRLEWHEPPGRPLNRLANRFGIQEVILLGLHEWLHVLRRNQSHVVSLRDQNPPEVVRAAAGFHPHETGRQVRQRSNQLGARALSPNDNPAARIKADEMKLFLPMSMPIVEICMDEILLFRDHHHILLRTGGGPSH